MYLRIDDNTLGNHTEMPPWPLLPIPIAPPRRRRHLRRRLPHQDRAGPRRRPTITNPVALLLPAGAPAGGAQRAVAHPPKPKPIPIPRANQKTIPKLGTHQIVQDRIRHRVQIDHDAAEVQKDVVAFRAQFVNRLFGRNDNPEGERAERDQTDEETDDDGAEHEEDLAPRPRRITVAVERGRRIADQVFGDDEIEDEQEEQGQDEKEENAGEEVEGGPEGVGRRVAHHHLGAVEVVRLLVAGQAEHGAANIFTNDYF